MCTKISYIYMEGFHLDCSWTEDAEGNMWIKVAQHWISWLAILGKSPSTIPFLWHLGESNEASFLMYYLLQINIYSVVPP